MHKQSFLRRFFQLHLDRRAYRGLSEFRFKSKRGTNSSERLVVKDRNSAFSQEVKLRKGTSDWLTFAQVFLGNDYNLRRLGRSDSAHGVYERILGSGAIPLILDLGANIGLASIYFAKNWPLAKIVALEPEPNNFELLCANTLGIDNIEPIMAAAASQDGTVSIMNPGAEAWAYRTTKAVDELAAPVQALSVDTLIDRALGAKPCVPFIAKVDIEGFEQDLFSENTDWVDRFSVLIVELHDWLFHGQASSKNFLQVISRLDRDFVFHGENVFSISNRPSFTA